MKTTVSLLCSQKTAPCLSLSLVKLIKFTPYIFSVILLDCNAYKKLFAKTFYYFTFCPNKILSIYIEPKFKRGTWHWFGLLKKTLSYTKLKNAVEECRLRKGKTVVSDNYFLFIVISFKNYIHWLVASTSKCTMSYLHL
jgi:hypothetical protein